MTVTQCNPSPDLGSMLRGLALPPGRKLSVALAALGLTKTDLASELGVSRPYFSRVINGHQASARLLRKVASRIGVEVSDIWPNGSEPRERASIR